MSPAPGSENEAEAGFALVEVLVAFAILSLVVVTMLRAFAGTTGTIGAVAVREARFDLAEEILATYRSRPRLVAGVERGARGDFTWWADIATVPSAGLPAPAPAGVARPFRISVGVDPPGGAARSEPPGDAVLTSLVLAVPVDG